VHIFHLIGFRNRVIVMAEWAWLYLRKRAWREAYHRRRRNCSSSVATARPHQVGQSELIKGTGIRVRVVPRIPNSYLLRILCRDFSRPSNEGFEIRDDACKLSLG
jgi:hypothetical protein